MASAIKSSASRRFQSSASRFEKFQLLYVKWPFKRLDLLSSSSTRTRPNTKMISAVESSLSRRFQPKHSSPRRQVLGAFECSKRQNATPPRHRQENRKNVHEFVLSRRIMLSKFQLEQQVCEWFNRDFFFSLSRFLLNCLALHFDFNYSLLCGWFHFIVAKYFWWVLTLLAKWRDGWVMCLTNNTAAVACDH